MSSLLRLDSIPSVRPTPPHRERFVRGDAAEAAATPKKADSFTSTFKQVSTAVEAGDLAGARDALDQMGTRGPAYTRATPPGRGPAQTPAHSNSRWNRQTEFQALVDAVRNDQITGAQDALTALRTPGLQTPTPAAPPADTPIDTPEANTPVSVGDVRADSPGEVPTDAPDDTAAELPGDELVQNLPEVSGETVSVEPAPGGASTGVLPPALVAQPIADASLVELLDASTQEPTT